MIAHLMNMLARNARISPLLCFHPEGKDEPNSVAYVRGAYWKEVRENMDRITIPETGGSGVVILPDYPSPAVGNAALGPGKEGMFSGFFPYGNYSFSESSTGHVLPKANAVATFLGIASLCNDIGEPVIYKRNSDELYIISPKKHMNSIDNGQLLEEVRKNVWRRTGTALHFHEPFGEADAILCGLAAAYEALCPYAEDSWSIDGMLKTCADSPELQVIASEGDSISLQGGPCRWDIILKKHSGGRAFGSTTRTFTVFANGREAFSNPAVSIPAVIRISSLYDEIAGASKEIMTRQMGRRIEKEIIKATRLAKKNNTNQ